MDDAELIRRLRRYLGDDNGGMNHPELLYAASGMSSKAKKWDEWDKAMGACEDELPEGWAIELRMSPGDWGLELTDPDGERVEFNSDNETMAQAVRSAIEAARASAKEGKP